MNTRKITSLPPELTDILFQLGNRKLVLLEGDDDVEVLENWFIGILHEIYFHAAEGNVNVTTYLDYMLNQSKLKEIYGIIDRDFRSDAEVAICNDDETNHLFILRRYAIENYLLEPPALWDELNTYHGRGFAKTKENIVEDLMNICRSLKIMMAANWVIKESGLGAHYFGRGHEICDREELILQTSRRLQWDVRHTEEKISVKEEIIESSLDLLENAHRFINGKHIFHQVFHQYVNPIKRGLRKDHLRNLLARNVKEKIGIHDDIVEIVERKIRL